VSTTRTITPRRANATARRRQPTPTDEASRIRSGLDGRKSVEYASQMRSTGCRREIARARRTENTQCHTIAAIQVVLGDRTSGANGDVDARRGAIDSLTDTEVVCRVDLEYHMSVLIRPG
jgi:hypothetical protein